MTETHDEAFFQHWIGSLKQSLLPTLPDVSSELLSSACETVQSYKKAELQAAAFKDQVSKRNPVDEDLLKQAEQLLNEAKQTTLESVDACQAVAASMLDTFETFTGDGYDDDELNSLAILMHMGPSKLASWCKDEKQDEQMFSFLGDKRRKMNFLEGGGARSGEYGRAVQIFDSIETDHSVCERLKTAIALELCDPPLRFGSATERVDPIKRFDHYKRAFFDGELDPAFEIFTVWEMRMAINSDATDEDLQWGRDCLKNYRPDIAYSDSAQWRYCFIVRTDVAYKNPEWYKDHRTYDQILSDGGKCGPRAWYGRFICKAFGIPTWGVRQVGHAAMSRWTTDGWMTCLGAGFQYAFWEGRGGCDFQLETKARHMLVTDEEYAKTIGRLELSSKVVGENNQSVLKDMLPSPDCPWASLALLKRKIASEKTRSSQPLPAATDPMNAIQKIRNTQCFKSLEDDGYVMVPEDPATSALQSHDYTIPASNTSKPLSPTKNVLFSKSFLGGLQLTMVSNASVEYMLPRSVYDQKDSLEVILKVCTVHRQEEPFVVEVKDGEEILSQTKIDVPFTQGMWGHTPPGVIDVAQARNEHLVIRITKQTRSFSISLAEITFSSK